MNNFINNVKKIPIDNLIRNLIKNHINNLINNIINISLKSY